MKTERFRFPPAVMGSHTAIVGKTGSGKTITAKDLVEQAYDDGANVCILDPIKSDWWGLTLDADGKRPGLPFHILGGPYGHVPLHAGAGAALGKLVATGALRHSIIDMALFGPGELNGFYNAFAEALFRNKTRQTGVLYLVLEEAHVFCPKEREGVRDENMAVYWTKRLATASRSQGSRIVAATQRTQALHNAVLGSSGTLLAHRLTFPADRKPVLDWLKVGMSAELAKQVDSSLASLKDGEAWFCCTESDPPIARRQQMPMIRTYDNSSTPTAGDAATHIHPPAIDQAALRAIVGEAVAEAEANDPKKLREEVARLKEQLADAGSHPIDQDTEEAAQERHEKNALRDELDQAKAEIERLYTRCDQLTEWNVVVSTHGGQLVSALSEAADRTESIARTVRERRDALVAEIGRTPHPPALNGTARSGLDDNPMPRRPLPAAEPARAPKPVSTAMAPASVNGDASGPLVKLATGMLWWQSIGVPAPTREQLGFVAGYVASGGSFKTYLSHARAQGILDYTDSGHLVAGPEAERIGRRPDRPGTTAELHRRVLELLDGPCQRILKVLIDHRGQPVTRTQLGELCGYEASGGSFKTYVSRLSGLKLAKYPNKTTVAASPLLFPRTAR